MSLSIIILLFVIIFAALHIFFDYKKNYLLTYLFKPLVLVTIIIFSILKTPNNSDNYKSLIIVGLFFSLLGDIFLMLKKKDLFIQGLASFLAAHISYIFAVSIGIGFFINFLSLIIAVFFLILLFTIIISNSGKYKIPVTLYGFVITFLLWQSLNRFSLLENVSALFLLLGIILFTISDFILAYNKFVKKIKFAQFYILPTYYLAQILITYSI
ncbi:MAG: lysoplasmalogenase [Ignavibacteriales bacterium]|nr:lysoplasmalogenase [Ignavibacteriales bacterium]